MQTRTWTAATCWQLLVALPLPKKGVLPHEETPRISGRVRVQVDEEIIPAIATWTFHWSWATD